MSWLRENTSGLEDTHTLVSNRKQAPGACTGVGAGLGCVDAGHRRVENYDISLLGGKDVLCIGREANWGGRQGQAPVEAADLHLVLRHLMFVG